MATYRTSFPGNSALQQDIWTLTPAEAKVTLALLDPAPGSYWHHNLVRPLRRALRNKATTVTVYTAGFSTSELSNALYNGDIPVTPEA
jgi:hypothetical protein